MSIFQKSRRLLLTSWGVAAGSFMLHRHSQAATLLKTPEAAEGPFYPTESMRPDDIDNDLVKVAGTVEEAGGEIILLTGRVRDHKGNPQQGLRVEIWQCDVNGKYLHTADSRKLAHDTGFQGFGHDITTARGDYQFRTIKPTHYPGRTPHIHVKVCKGERELLTTQFYLNDEPSNAKDSLYRRLDDKQADAVMMNLKNEGDWPTAVVDIVV